MNNSGRRILICLATLIALADGALARHHHLRKHHHKNHHWQQASDAVDETPAIITAPVKAAVPTGMPKAGDLGATVFYGVHVNYWDNAKLGQSPLIIFSHAFGGCGTQASYLTTALAKQGWLVVAPDHFDAACKSKSNAEKPLSDPALWDETTFLLRRDEMRKVYRGLHNDSAWKNRIDWSRVALLGHSLGGYTALAMVGGMPGWRVDGYSAVLAMSPYCGAMPGKGSLNTINVPVMYLGGSKDDISANTVTNSDGCFAHTSGEVSYVEIANANHMSFADAGGTGHEAIAKAAIEFFSAVFNGKPVKPSRAAGVSELRQK